MTTNPKYFFQSTFCVSISLLLILSFSLAKINNSNVLDLFDGVVKTNASSGDVNPTRICSSNGYNQFTETPTLGDINLNTTVNTDIVITNLIATNAITTPALSPNQNITAFCPQTFSPFGQFFDGANLYNQIPDGTAYYNGNYINTFFKIGEGQDFTFRPNSGFVGLACFNVYTLLYNPTSSSFQYEDSNIAQVKINVGGSPRTTCGTDIIPGSITGKIYNDTNINGIQGGIETDYNATTNVLPVGTTITITDTNNSTNSFTITPNVDGTYSQDVSAGQYTVTVNPPTSHRVSGSTELGDPTNTGANPTTVSVSSGETKSVGKDGLYFIPITGTGQIQGTIFHDANSNGQQDNGELGIPGIGVQLLKNITVGGGEPFYSSIDSDVNVPGIQITIATTDTNGNYSFGNLSDEKYYVGNLENNTIFQTQTADPDSLFDTTFFTEISLTIRSVVGNFGLNTTISNSAGGVITIQNKVTTNSSVVRDNPMLQNNSQQLATLAIDRLTKNKLDLNDPYNCGINIYGNVVSNPKIIADLKIEFTQLGVVVKTYNLKTNSDGTWEQYLDDLPFGEYSYKVVASYQDLSDTESFSINHRSPKECQGLSNIQSNVETQAKYLNTIRTGGESSTGILILIIFILSSLAVLPIVKVKPE